MRKRRSMGHNLLTMATVITLGINSYVAYDYYHTLNVKKVEVIQPEIDLSTDTELSRVGDSDSADKKVLDVGCDDLMNSPQLDKAVLGIAADDYNAELVTGEIVVKDSTSIDEDNSCRLDISVKVNEYAPKKYIFKTKLTLSLEVVSE